jgi:peroxiredoxin
MVGHAAPDFTLRDQDGKKITLSELRGQNVVLVFYPLDWSPVCTDQLNLYQDAMNDFKKQGASLYGVSVDSAFSHKAFQDHPGSSSRCSPTSSRRARSRASTTCTWRSTARTSAASS